MSGAARLSDDVRLDVVYADETEFGSAVGGRADREIARLAGATAPDGRPVERWSDLFSASKLGALYASRDRLRPEILYPDPARVRPVALRVLAGAGNDAGEIVPLPLPITSDLARWLGDWQRGSGEPRSGAARELWESLRAVGALGEANGSAEAARTQVARESIAGVPGAVFVGHATVRIDSGNEAQLFDPFLVPPSVRTSYSPLTPAELGSCAVFITHSHPDHFALGTLLRLGADTEIFVPTVPRESLLAVDMAARLEELGFKRVRQLSWHESIVSGRSRVSALPFFGEQPTVDDQLHPEVRNCGNTYQVEAAGTRYAVIADAGVDRMGSMTRAAAEAQARGLGADIVFGGYRAWSLYPHQYPATSVARYVLFVPAAQRGVRQKIMNDAADLIDTAERWGAETVVPYADGGAPWFWDMGLGPRLDREGEDEHFDPAPETVERAAHYRSNVRGVPVSSPVRVRIMRPGQLLAGGSAAQAPVDLPGHVWPFGAALDGRTNPAALLRRTVMSERELVALARKKVLLRLLAAPELERLGIEVTAGEVQALLDRLRSDSGLETAEKMSAWLAMAGLDRDALAELMYEWTGVVKLEERYRAEIDANVDVQVGFGTMRNWPRTHD